MPVIDFSPRLTRVYITNPDGSNSLEVTDLLVDGIETSDTPIRTGDGGAIFTTGSITLNISNETLNGESLNPYENPQRFSKGMRVYVEVLLDDGTTYVPHPRGELRILKRPAPPRDEPTVDSQVITLELGCELSLKNYRQPTGDASCIPLGEETEPGTIITRIARKAGLPDLQDSIPTNPINYPVFDLDGSYVDLMGRLAYVNEHTLWMNNQGQLRAQAISLNSSQNRDYRFTVGKDEKLFDPYPGIERPVELVRTTGITQELESTEPEPEFESSRNPTEFRTTTYSGWGTNQITTTHKHVQEKGIVFPEEFPDSRSLITRTLEYKTDFYAPPTSDDPCEDNSNGELLRTETIVREPTGVLLPDDFPGDTSGAFGEVVNTVYRYQNDELREIFSTTQRPTGQIDSDATVGLTLLGLSDRAQEIWVKKGDRYQKSTYRSNFQDEPTALISASTGPTGSTTLNQPPATQRRPSAVAEVSRAIEGKARFSTGPGSDYDVREREFQFQSGVATSKAQLRKVAKMIGRILQGRDFGYTFAIPLTDDIIQNYKPLMVMDWTYRGRRVRYLANGLNIVIGEDEALIGGQLIELGVISINEPDGTYIPPDSTLIEVAPSTFVTGESLYDEFSDTGSVSYGNPVISTSYLDVIDLGDTRDIFTSNVQVLGYDVNEDLGTVNLGSTKNVFSSFVGVVTPATVVHNPFVLEQLGNAKKLS